ncbi:acyl-CoA/acyl-ACP dehydrogenase [Diaphorobacter sp. NR2-3-3-1]|nr:acyl-CoA/acyl-ACP dehydrogenase [Diaphorobacter caeni]
MIAESAAVFLSENSASARVREVAERQGGFDRALWEQVCEMGWSTVALPEAAGGMGLGLMELVLLSERMGAHLACVPFFDAVVAPAALWRHLCLSGSGLAVVQRLALSSKVCVLGMTVRGALSASARVVVDGASLVLDGRWPQVASGAVADVFILPTTLPCGSLALLEVAADTAGLTVEALATVDGTRTSAHVTAAQVKLADSAVLVQGDALLALWAELRSFAAIALAAEQVGVAERALELAVEYTKERVQFGKAVAVFQGVKHRAAQMLVGVEMSRSAVYGAAAAADAGAVGEALFMCAAQARSEATEAALFATRECIQLHGGVGFTWEFDPHLYFRRAQTLSQRMGTVEQWHEEVAALLFDADGQPRTQQQPALEAA